MTGDLFTARFTDSHFDETVFPSLGGDRKKDFPREWKELSWYVPTQSHFDPRTLQCEIEVKRIVVYEMKETKEMKIERWRNEKEKREREFLEEKKNQKENQDNE